MKRETEFPVESAAVEAMDPQPEPLPQTGTSQLPESASPRETESDLIAATLAWCARRFGANASRFVRPTDAGGWLVITWLNESISAHPADSAETAMAWIVALGRKRLLVSRPRVSAGEGGAVRPISARNYLGIPVICHDRVLGVIEVAGDLRPDIEAAAAAAQEDIDRFALRLGFDTAVRPIPPLYPRTVIALSGGSWPEAEIPLSADDLCFAGAVTGHMPIDDVARAVGMPLKQAVEVARELERRGMILVVEKPLSPESDHYDG